MYYLLLADLVVLLHLAFIIFAVFGGIIIIWWRKVLWLHVPAVLWSGWIEFSEGICPLTPLENWLRAQGGQAAYAIDFVGQYIIALVYPASLTRRIQVVLGAIVIIVNVLIYGYVFIIRRSALIRKRN
jgi:hypothetical protein